MKKQRITVIEILLISLFGWAFIPGHLYSQQITFGDLIPPQYLPATIDPANRLNCETYFRLADSINAEAFGLTGTNPVPAYHCGNDTTSYGSRSIETYVNELSPGTILARMIIDRNGNPVCCKVYMRGVSKPDKELADAFSRMTMMPSFRNGRPIPTECRILYDFLAPKKPGGKTIDDFDY